MLLRIIFISFLSLATSCSFSAIDKDNNGSYRASGKNAIHTIYFDNSKNITTPAKLIIIDDYLKKNGSIFLISQDYGTKNNSQLIEYNIKTKSIVKKIAIHRKINSKKGGRYQINMPSHIVDHAYDNNHISWYVHHKGKVIVYSYNIHNGKTSVLSKIPNSKPGYPLSLKLDNGYVAWIEHNVKKETSSIVLFDIKKKNKKIIKKIPFVNSSFPTVTFLELKDGKIFYNEYQSKKPNIIKIYDIKKHKTIKEITAIEGSILHFSGSYSKNNNSLSLYAKIHPGKKMGLATVNDVVYIYDLNNDKITLLTGMSKHSVLLDDKIDIYDDFVHYNIQRNVSGKIIDHYYGETYDINKKKQIIYRRSIDIKETDKYFGLLEFTSSLLDQNYVTLKIFKK